VGQNLLNRNPHSTVATASGLHPFLRLLYARYGLRSCPACGTSFHQGSEDEIVERVVGLSEREPVSLLAAILRDVPGSHRTLLDRLGTELDEELLVDGRPFPRKAGTPQRARGLDPREMHTILAAPCRERTGLDAASARALVRRALALGAGAVLLRLGGTDEWMTVAPACTKCQSPFRSPRAVSLPQRVPEVPGPGRGVPSVLRHRPSS